MKKMQSHGAVEAAEASVEEMILVEGIASEEEVILEEEVMMDSVELIAVILVVEEDMSHGMHPQIQVHLNVLD